MVEDSDMSDLPITFLKKPVIFIGFVRFDNIFDKFKMLSLLFALCASRKTGIVKKGITNPVILYASPDEEGEVIAELNPCQKLRILETGEDFLRVKAGSLIGYVKSKYVSVRRHPRIGMKPNGVGQGRVVIDNSPILSKPGSGSKIAVANVNDILYVHYAAPNAYWAVSYKGVNGFIQAYRVKLL